METSPPEMATRADPPRTASLPFGRRQYPQKSVGSIATIACLPSRPETTIFKSDPKIEAISDRRNFRADRPMSVTAVAANIPGGPQQAAQEGAA